QLSARQSGPERGRHPHVPYRASVPLHRLCPDRRGSARCGATTAPSERIERMLDLGTSFLASVARDPQAVAIVDGEVRLTYAAWYRQVSALIEGFDELELEPGDHLVTVLQNRYEAASIHWACQLAGIIV